MIDIRLPNKHKTFLVNEHKNVPSKPGIYQFYNSEKELLYVGKAANLKTRIKAHLSGKSNTHLFYEDFHHVRVYCLSDPADRELLETYMINKLKPKYNISKVYFDRNEPTSEVRNVDYKKFEEILKVIKLMLNERGYSTTKLIEKYLNFKLEGIAKQKHTYFPEFDKFLKENKVSRRGHSFSFCYTSEEKIGIVLNAIIELNLKKNAFSMSELLNYLKDKGKSYDLSNIEEKQLLFEMESFGINKETFPNGVFFCNYYWYKGETA